MLSKANHSSQKNIPSIGKEDVILWFCLDRLRVELNGLCEVLGRKRRIAESGKEHENNCLCQKTHEKSSCLYCVKTIQFINDASVSCQAHRIPKCPVPLEQRVLLFQFGRRFSVCHCQLLLKHTRAHELSPLATKDDSKHRPANTATVNLSLVRSDVCLFNSKVE